MYRSCLILLLIISCELLPQQTSSGIFFNVEYLYFNADTADQTGIIVHVPGFTEHSRIPESVILQTAWKELGYSFLVMDPPQHAEGRPVLETGYSWGENEPATLKALLQHLGIRDKHDKIHLLGFSIGAKIALRFAALESNEGELASVTAVAAPYTVQDINMRLSGDIMKPHEGLISGFYAVDRVGIARMLNMVLIGMNRHILGYPASPANTMKKIQTPLLFVHGVDDWLTKSYHSRLLAELSGIPDKTSVVYLDTRAHSADMLSRDHSDTRNAFLGTLHSWWQYVEEFETEEKQGSQFTASKFSASLKNNPAILPKLYQEHVASITSPTFFDPTTWHWITASDQIYAPVAGGVFRNEEVFSAMLNFGTSSARSYAEHGWQGSISYFRGPEEDENWDAGISWYMPNNGWLLRFRRISLVGSLSNFDLRSYAAIDLAYLLFDFQLSAGRFYDKGNDWHIHINWPMIGNASAKYFLGSSYSQFLTNNGFQLYKKNLKFYLHFGPREKTTRMRIHFNLQYDIRQARRRYEQRLGIGLNFNFSEK